MYKKLAFFIFISMCCELNGSVVETPEEQPTNTTSAINISAPTRVLDRHLVNLYQDVDGYEDDYLRCSMCLFRFGGNASKTLSKVLIISSSVMTGLVAIPNLFDENTKIIVGGVSSVFGIVSIALLSFKTYSEQALVDRQEQLLEVILNHGRGV